MQRNESFSMNWFVSGMAVGKPNRFIPKVSFLRHLNLYSRAMNFYA